MQMIEAMDERISGSSGPIKLEDKNCTTILRRYNSYNLTHPAYKALAEVGAEVVWAMCSEMARTVEDVPVRRTRALLLGARATGIVDP